MSTSTDASTVIGEARPAVDGTPTEESTALGGCTATEEGTVLAEAAPVGTETCAEEGTAADGSGAPDESPATADVPPTGDTVAGECAAPDEAAPADASMSLDAPPAAWLRIEKGHAEPEEIAAISVVLCARLAGLRALADNGDQPPSTARRRHARHTACWSGCWSCG
ncbi:acyl-CoA carboxylase subunit epsilon [Streptomyces angustmyceticus]|uniref:Acyl-CoA carboxylase subunit epsilon n=1 Tax=Streptomyces angustmyceticus TaxID=285578 RepID=A0A5J4L1P1_9ACTN|nr:acyl-CoA carboxylase subunit epsilon [Streptomyces angustmyceticus]GES28063.1 hypothetical protein San01_05500 [Streptomyces angustmyceticus]